MARKLASIQQILNLEPIEGADAIEKATVLGWQVVVKKGEFQVGDFCIYCEIDSLLPERPEFEFLKSRQMRIKTMRLRGQVSQGICFPLDVLPSPLEPEEGLDVTEHMGVTKYEPPIPMSLVGSMRGAFPGFIPKTDETRVQVLQPVLSALQGLACYITEKLDGSSVTYFISEDEFHVCSRNLDLLESPGNLLWKVARELELENKLRSLKNPVALQGELIGPSVQSNRYKIQKNEVHFFNVFDLMTNTYLDFDNAMSLLDSLDLNRVPVLEKSKGLIDSIPELVEWSKGKSQLNSNVHREGIVIRPLQEQTTHLENLGRVSFKVINPDFLLKYDL